MELAKVLKTFLGLYLGYPLLKIHIYSIMTNKKNVMHWGKFKYFLEQVTIKFIQIFICM
jgi:hypothetical protein